MSIVLKSGIVVPDVPDDLVADGYSNLMLAYSKDRVYATSCTGPYIYVSESIAGGQPYIFTGLSMKICNIIPGDGATWSKVTSLGPGYHFGTEGVDAYSTVYTVEWVNHSIIAASSLNDDGTANLGNTVYIWSSFVTPLVLSDGKELPALPDGCFEGRPYGMIAIDSGSYGLMCSPLPFGYISAEVGAAHGITNNAVGTMSKTGKLYVAVADKWVEETWVYPMLVTDVAWLNHDVYTAESFNINSETVVFGGLWRKSDVNYRITDGWMRSITDQARRLGSITGGMKPFATETTLRGVQVGTGGGGGNSDIPSAAGVLF